MIDICRFILQVYNSLIVKPQTFTLNAQAATSADSEEQPKCEWHWSTNEHGRESLLHEDKLTVTFHPNHSLCCSAVRGTRQLMRNMEHYFEVEFKSPFHGQARMVGIGTRHTHLETHPYDYYPLLGKDGNSWGLNYNGSIYHDGNHKEYVRKKDLDLDKFSAIQVGVHYDGCSGIICFIVNGKNYGIAFQNIHTSLELYPMICSSASNSTITLTESFSCVVSLKALCRGVIRKLFSDSEVDKLRLPTHLKAYVKFDFPSNSTETDV